MSAETFAREWRQVLGNVIAEFASTRTGEDEEMRLVKKAHRISRRTFLTALCAVALVPALPAGAVASGFSQFAPSGGERVKHEAFDRLLQRYVKPDANRYNRVDYRAFREGGLQELQGYIAEMLEVEPARLSANEAHAYWINLYNAKTLEVVLARYPVQSIKDIKLGGGGLFKTGPWSRKILAVSGTELSLDDIEHEIVRALFADPMSHYGLNCASYSCPNLAVRAYTGATVESLLAEGGRDYINHPRGLRVAGSRITASKVYSWYADDFGGRGGLKKHWKMFASPTLSRSIDTASIEGYAYDWSLNDVG